MPPARHQTAARGAQSPPALIVGGSGSNSGKTVATLALLCALRARGLRIHMAKTGPDYIDTAFHAALSGMPAANLDIWMSRAARPARGQGRPLRRLPAGLQRLVARMCTPGPDGRPPDLLLTEGAMGLYDGGACGEGCTAQLATLLGWPVLLILAARGLGQSVAALAEGFLRHRPRWLAAGQTTGFAGLICTHLGSPRHAAIVREALGPVCANAGVPLLGLLPRAGAPLLPSRHLGLHEARETLPTLDTAALAHWLEAHCDVSGLLKRLGLPSHGERPTPAAEPSPSGASALPPPAFPTGQAAFFPLGPPCNRHRKRYRIGIARDAAFSFCYADLPALLEELGAECVFFSPLADAAPPPCHGLYFPGGYPELHAQGLAVNRPMLAALRQLAEAGLPIYGECGGYIYLMQAIEVEGRSLPMSGLLPLTCRLEQGRAALGYRLAEALPGWPASEPAARPLRVRGHEFHYAALLPASASASCAQLWRLRDSHGTELGPEGCRCGKVAGSWLHLYPEGARRFWRSWLAALPARLPCPR